MVLAGLGIYRYTDGFKKVELPKFPQKETEEKKEEGMDLPEGWQEVEVAEEEVVVKLTKETESEIETNIVLMKIEDIDYESPEEYTDRLINGAKSALPSLTFSDDEVEENDYYIRKLTGRYWNAGDQVEVKQQIYVGENEVYVITASYASAASSEELTSEINNLFDKLSEEYLKN